MNIIKKLGLIFCSTGLIISINSLGAPAPCGNNALLCKDLNANQNHYSCVTYSQNLQQAATDLKYGAYICRLDKNKSNDRKSRDLDYDHRTYKVFEAYVPVRNK
jgi:hypothetical protein